MEKESQRSCEDPDHQQYRTKNETIKLLIVTAFQLLLLCIVSYLLVELQFLKDNLAQQQDIIKNLQRLRTSDHNSFDQFETRVIQRSNELNDPINEVGRLDSPRRRREAGDVSPTSSTDGQGNDCNKGGTNERLLALERTVKKQHPQWSSVHIYTSKSKFLNNLNDTQMNQLLQNEEVPVHGGFYQKDKGYKPKGTTLRVWQKHNWNDNMSYMPIFADISNLWEEGTVMIREAGLYLIYAQVTFQTSALHQSISIHDSVKDKSLATCIVSERFNIDEHKKVTEDPTVYLPCSVTTVQYLKNNTTLTLKSLYEGRRILLRESFTYWGVTQLWRE